MPLTRRALLRGLPLLLALPRVSEAQATWTPSAHPLNDPHTCLGWWLTTPLTGTVTWRDLLRRQTGTLTSMALLTSATSGLQRRTTRPGGWGHVGFDGTNDAIVTTAVANGLLTLSVSAWMRTSTVARQYVVGQVQDDVGPNPGWDLGVRSDGSLLFYYQEDGDTAWYGKHSTMIIADGTWHHVAVTVQATQLTALTILLYVDGQAVTTGTISQGTVTTISNALTVRLGSFAAGTAPYAGALDDVRLYARTLPAHEIRLLYQDSRLGYPTLLQPGPQVAYTLPLPPIPLEPLPSLLMPQ